MALNKVQKRLVELARMHGKVNRAMAVVLTKLDSEKTDQLLAGCVAHGCLVESAPGVFLFNKVTPKSPIMIDQSEKLF